MYTVPTVCCIRYVWSPAGGWWNNPRNWRTNTVAVLGGVVLVNYYIQEYIVRDNVISIDVRTFEAKRPDKLHHTSVWDLETRLPTGKQYKGLSSTTGRKDDSASSDDSDE